MSTNTQPNEASSANAIILDIIENRNRANMELPWGNPDFGSCAYCGGVIEVHHYEDCILAEPAEHPVQES